MTTINKQRLKSIETELDEKHYQIYFGDKKKISDHVDTNGIIHVKEEEKSKVENEKTGESGDKKEDSKEEEDEKEKSPDPPPVGLIELVDFDLLSIKP